MRALCGVFVFVLALVLSAPVLAANFQAGLDAAERVDYAAALKEWRPLAEQGHADAQYNMGVLYDHGWGAAQDYAASAKWYRLAAEQGHADAQYNLGVLYDHGWGVAQDYVQAHMWFNLAAARLPPGGDRDRVVHNRDNAEKHMMPDQVVEARRLAREWKPK